MGWPCKRLEAKARLVPGVLRVRLVCTMLLVARPQLTRADSPQHSPESTLDADRATSGQTASDGPGASRAPESESTRPPESVEATAGAGPGPGYTDAIDRAIDEHERGNFEEAREHFRAAHEIFPNARTLRGLGKIEFELRNYGEAVKYLTAALASTVRPLTPDLRDEVRRVVERARAYVGEVHVDVQPGSATVSVDGVTMATGPQAALRLLVGDHLLEFRAAGRLPERRQIRVRGGEQMILRVTLVRPEMEALTKYSGSERPLDGKPIHRQWWVWTAASVVVAGAVTAVVLATRDRDPKTRAVSAGPADWIAVNP